MSSAAWAFTKKTALFRQRFERAYGSADTISISEFHGRYGSDVQIVDILDPCAPFSVAVNLRRQAPRTREVGDGPCSRA